MKKCLLPLISLIAIMACNGGDPKVVDDTHPPVSNNNTSGVPAPAAITLNITAVHPHDTSAYTQGLEFYQGKLYEGTGDFESSSLRVTDAKSGQVEQKHVMGSADVFGEGITVFKNKIYQLTWQSNLVNVYDVKNINQPIKTYNWPYEGWGITHNDSLLIISTGSSNLYFVDPNTFKVVNNIQVVGNNGPVDELNELEMIDGYIFANVYQTDAILKIDPSNGHVVGMISLPGLKQQYFGNQVNARTDVLNGMAYDSTSKKLFFTGKRWPKMFEATINQ